MNCFGYDFKVGVLANNGMVLAKSTKENSLYIYIYRIILRERRGESPSSSLTFG